MNPALLTLLVLGGPEPQPQAPGMEAQDPWAQFAEERQGKCLGPKGSLSAPISIEAGRHRYRLEGHRLVQLDHDRDKVLRIGVISATKDDRQETLDAIASLLSQLQRLGMDVLVANGDLASHEINMDERLFPALADSGVLVVAHTGNTESCGAFNIAATKTFATRRNFINANWVRQIELDDGTLVTLPGYYDKRFVHTAGAARYGPDDLFMLRSIFRESPGPKILVSHGPPRMSGKAGIDIATGAGHVGDPAMTKLLRDMKVPFGIFGHILEAGGRASDLAGRKARAPNRWHRDLYVNAGTANTDPWPMLGGRTSRGMGMHVEIRGKQARYRVLKPKLGR